jgi:AmmeMemoRadiSam system protein B
MEAGQSVRPSPIAGQWYTSDPRRLASQVDQYIQNAKLPDISGTIVAVMAPHAGHRYSGPVAGYAFAALRGLKPEVVAIVSPMHYPYPEPLLTTTHLAYATPLGEIPVDQQTVNALDLALKNELGFGLTRIANDPEHSLEIELPFLQRALELPFKLLPVMVRDQSDFVMQRLGRALASVLTNFPTLLVASTDLSHFYPQSIAHKLDSEMLRQVEAFDPAGVIRVEQAGMGFACGRGALASVMWAAKALGANHAQVLNYATSGDVIGDLTQVVGYGAAIFTNQSVNVTN